MGFVCPISHVGFKDGAQGPNALHNKHLTEPSPQPQMNKTVKDFCLKAAAVC